MTQIHLATDAGAEEGETVGREEEKQANLEAIRMYKNRMTNFLPDCMQRATDNAADVEDLVLKPTPMQPR